MREQNFGRLNIILAVYGLKTITEHIKNLIIDGQPQTLNFTVNNRIIGEDGWVGQRKSIMVLYNYDNGDLQVAAAKEGDILIINPDTIKTSEPLYADTAIDSSHFSILAATYGPKDVTHKLQKMLSPYNTLAFKIDNSVFEDSWYGVAKTMVVVLGIGSEVQAVEVFVEREACYIDLNETIPAL